MSTNRILYSKPDLFVQLTGSNDLCPQRTTSSITESTWRRAR
jgi:hypothetical protein